MKLRGGIKELAFNPAGDQLASASYSNPRIIVWSLPAGEILHTLPGHDVSSGISCLTYSPDGQRIASGSPNLTVKVWSAGDR